jgi:predicted anti-sigma-YlaC factor YlaD
MNLDSSENQQLYYHCEHSSEIAAYLDGELDQALETKFEQHLNECSVCAEKLNEQKRLLCTLDLAFNNEKNFQLPHDFVANIVVRAESNVTGLRLKEERRNALFIVLGLILSIVVIALTSEKNELMLFTTQKLLAKFSVVLHLFANFFYDIGVGTFVVLRALNRQLLSFDASVIGLFLVVFVASLLALSRLLSNESRAKY